VRSWPSRRAATAWRRHRRAGRHPDLGAGGGPAGLSGRGWVLTGVGLAVEIGDWHRFTGATVGAWLGLVPSEQSSGGRRSQGSITKTGNTMPDGCWSRRPGITATPIGPAGNSAPVTTNSPLWSENAPTRATAGCSSAGASWTLG
jgi:hypothetical protein